MKKRRRRHLLRFLVLSSLSIVLCLLGISLLWISSWKLPNIESLGERKVAESTKIYDRTGEVLLYDLHKEEQRTIVPYAEISRHIKNATVAIEDAEFWQHQGVRPRAILRAVYANIRGGNLLGGQGGSTITQQVVKNTLLTREKTISRKLKEWVLAWRLEQKYDKESILSLYLNEIPYGGTIYGIEEAAETFFGKSAHDLTIEESAYLAAIPNAPTFYSPYGNNKDKLEERKNLVLLRMRESTFISEEEYEQARRAVVAFKPNRETGILAPHFVMYIRQELEEKFGRERLESGGLKIITTLDYDLQKIGEETVKKYALENKEKFDAENAALVALDPKNGQILAMVGSRDYFDKEIDGNFNATIAYRQPGSAFKPIVYAQALREGYTPETVVFDLPTEFSVECNPDGNPIVSGNEEKCYRPENYDGRYRGPVTFREALAQSINVPSIQVLYLAGLTDSLRLAKDMGLTTLEDENRYGLTLVLGGGEVKLLELTGVYGVFAAGGMSNAPAGILRIENKDGTILEEFKNAPIQVLPENIALTITDILADNRARAPAFSLSSPLFFPGRDVAAKTGTTNDFRDAWIFGYTPNLVVGAWAGNNDNRPMHKIAAYIVAPLWHAFMEEVLKKLPEETFQKPPEEDLSALPPILRGIWQGNQTYFVDKLSGKRATSYTPQDLKEERAVRNIHSTLFWIEKDDPRVLRTSPPENDPQFPRWEYAVRKWVQEQGLTDQGAEAIPQETDPYHTENSAPRVSFTSPQNGKEFAKNESVTAALFISSKYPISKVHFFVNNLFLGTSTKAPWSFPLSLSEIDTLEKNNELKAIAYDVVENRGESTVVFTTAD